jgi:hypothetical protein
MMDAAKVADLVLLMIDGSFGLEMETFEFLNLLQVSRCYFVMLHCYILMLCTLMQKTWLAAHM